MKLFDAHTHLNDTPFLGKEAEYIQRAKDLTVTDMAIIGSNPDMNQRAVELSEEFDPLYAVVGFHPDDAKLYNEQEEAVLKELLQKEKTVAVGEIGLDYHWDASKRSTQHEVFERQLQLAYDMKLPVSIHTRDAFEDTYAILKNFGKVDTYGGVIHSFNGNPDQLQRYLDLGLNVSYSGVASFKNAKEVHESVIQTPLDRMMVETDAPYLTPTPYRGKQNEPGYTYYVTKAISELKGIDVEEVADATYRNTLKFYNLD
ncbi:TatD family hydrolase [Holzapfeliella floricola]|uniref:Dnase n=1 Tax=Holzapfeliella floricola DSM 23037 = JCM 16512 TaxID=1423744 RepID=A0A0R2DVS2_9LACO|nr:TatD family hydrolase [Holzapfeliella floricola]KRN04333.1 dnase [Holzapfeliella floricola DSM 23037 = JCM 16512]